MITALAARLRSREATCTDLTAEALNAIEREQPRLNAFATVTADHARERAAALDRELAAGQDRGPLHGIPVAIKDLIHMRGVPTTGGSLVYRDHIAAESADVVERLELAGAVIVGKTSLHELAYGITSNNAHFGAVRNPHDTQRVPGGSSGGSGAAVAAGIVAMALGTDTGGSIRIPAAYCGCVGLKPTFGRVSKRGVLPLGFSLDHIGPLAASVEDAAIALHAIADKPEDFVPQLVGSLAGVRVGRPANVGVDRVAPDVRAKVEAAFERAERLGAAVMPVALPDLEPMNAAARVILLAEAAAALGPHLEHRELFSPEVLALFDQGRVLPATMYVDAQRLRRRMVQEMTSVWRQVDCFLLPSTPTTAPFIGATQVEIGGIKEDVRLVTTALTRSINLLGSPAISIPCGRGGSGLPIGLQIAAPPNAEKDLLRIAREMEAA